MDINKQLDKRSVGSLLRDLKKVHPSITDSFLSLHFKLPHEKCILIQEGLNQFPI